MKKVLFSIFFVILQFANFANAQTMELRWADKPKAGLKISSFEIHIGTESRDYQQSKRFSGKTLAIDIAELALESQMPNFIAATKNNIPIFSSEIVLMWTGDRLDSDQDGLFDLLEQGLGTNPFVKDSDDDEIPDGVEYATWGLEKWNLDFDEDGTINLLDPDSDDDGIIDGQDPDIRKIPHVFYSSTNDLGDDDKTFIELVLNRKYQRDFRSGTESITINWDERPERSARVRVYSTTKVLPIGQQQEFENERGYLNVGSYDFSIWEGETKDTKLVVEKLEKGLTYYVTLQILNPAGEISGPSPEKKITIPH